MTELSGVFDKIFVLGTVLQHEATSMQSNFTGDFIWLEESSVIAKGISE